MPAEYRSLGLDERRSCSGTSPGTSARPRSTRRLSDAPRCAGLPRHLFAPADRSQPAARLSRAAFPVRSEDTDIPGNVGLDAAERTRRAKRMFAPFHDRVAAHLDRRKARADRRASPPSTASRRCSWARRGRGMRAFSMARPAASARRSARPCSATAMLNVGANVPYTITPRGRLCRAGPWRRPRSARGADRDAAGPDLERGWDRGVGRTAGRRAACASQSEATSS